MENEQIHNENEAVEGGEMKRGRSNVEHWRLVAKRKVGRPSWWLAGRKFSYDQRCYDLAEVFLPEETEEVLEALAQTIQDAIEDFLSGKVIEGVLKRPKYRGKRLIRGAK